MRFRAFGPHLAGVPFLIVDGVEPGGLHLSHWPGNATPARLKADTTTEMAIRLAKDPTRADWLRGVDVVTNNHFDTDGILSTWAALYPEDALLYENVLVAGAEAGDFGWYRDAEAVQLDLTIEALGDPFRSPWAKEVPWGDPVAKDDYLYERIHGLLPALLFTLDDYREFWGPEWEEILASFLAIRKRSLIREHPESSLSVIETPAALHHTARINSVDHDRLLTLEHVEGGVLASLEYHIYTWFETVGRPKPARVDLSGAARDLTRMEKGGTGAWIYSGPDALTATLQREHRGEAVPSTIPPGEIERLLVERLRGV